MEPDVEPGRALAAFAALSHEARLEVFRMLVRESPEGLLAGEIGRALDLRQSTMSTHLAVLTRARLISGRREGRGVRYTAEVDHMCRLVGFLLADRCSGERVAAPRTG